MLSVPLDRVPCLLLIVFCSIQGKEISEALDGIFLKCSA